VFAGLQRVMYWTKYNKIWPQYLLKYAVSIFQEKKIVPKTPIGAKLALRSKSSAGN